jgi:hypothetical protein
MIRKRNLVRKYHQCLKSLVSSKTGAYRDTSSVRFPSSFGTGPDNALMPTVLAKLEENNERLVKIKTCRQSVF